MGKLKRLTQWESLLPVAWPLQLSAKRRAYSRGVDARRFHELTKHTPASVRRGTRALDWANKPHPFKEYVDLEPIPLPPPASDTDVPATEAIVGRRPDVGRSLTLPELTRLLELGAGVLRERVFADGERLYFRTYACAGALYPIELYVACSDIDGLASGLYHFHPRERSLRRVGTDDPRPHLSRACAHRDAVAGAPLALVLTGIPWRTTWKYELRGYRHLYWDGGMIVANVLALAASAGFPAEVVAGFADDEVNALVGVDGRSEMALAVMPIGFSSENRAPSVSGPRVPTVARHAVAPLSPRAREYPELDAAHAAGALAPEEVASWQRPPEPPSRWSRATLCHAGLERVIRRRGSARAFSQDPISGDQFADVIARALCHVPSDWGSPLIEIAAIVNAGEGLEPGTYRSDEGQLRLFTTGDFRDSAYWLCLEQPLGGDAAATVFLLADLRRTVSQHGSRGYRAAQLEAGIRAGRLYLGAYACGFGATGLTFYDDEVRKFFETDLEPMLVVALGRPARFRRLL
jgi:SagB-type dehydrogenase family enzyme